MWPDCSPPSRPPSRCERLEHVAVADVGGDDADAVLAHQLVKSEVRHHRDRDQIDPRSSASTATIWSPSTRAAVLVDREHPVAVSVEGDPEVETLFDDRALQERGVGRAAADVDVRAVGLDPDRDDLGAALLERLRREPGVGAVRAVDDDPQPGEIRAEAVEHVLAGTSRSRSPRARPFPGRPRERQPGAPRSAPPNGRSACARVGRRT